MPALQNIVKAHQEERADDDQGPESMNPDAGRKADGQGQGHGQDEEQTTNHSVTSAT